MDCNKIWNDLQDAIKNAVSSEVSYNVHIKPAKAIAFDNSVFTISVPSSINRNMIEFRFKNKIEGIIEAFTGQKVTLKILLESEVSKPKEKESKYSELLPDMDDEFENFPLNGKFTFENFVVGSSNNVAASIAIAACEKPGLLHPPLFIYGKSGLGKTHLMSAIGNRIKDNYPDYNIIYTPVEAFTNNFINSIRNTKLDALNTSMEKFRNKYRSADVLLVDDVQFLQNKEAVQEEFFHTINSLQSRNKMIVFTCDTIPAELVKLDERLLTRFQQALNMDVSVPDFETRIAILQKKSEINEYNISNEVIEYIATRIKSNIRELEGALTKIVSIAELTHKEITIELAKYAIDSILPKDGVVKITPDKIIDKVTVFYNITREEILSKNKVRNIVLPRQVAMYLCSKLTDMNMSTIGRVFKKDRTTVISNSEKIKEQIEINKELNEDIEFIIKDLQNN